MSLGIIEKSLRRFSHTAIINCGNSLKHRFGAFILRFGSPPAGFQKFYKRKDYGTNGRQDDPKKPNRKFENDATYWALGVAGLGIAAVYLANFKNAKEITMQEFLNDFLVKGFVEKVDVRDHRWVFVKLRPGTPFENQQFMFQIGSVDSFESKLESVQSTLGLHPSNFVPIQYSSDDLNISHQILRAIPTIAIGIILLIGLNKALGSALQGGGGGMGPASKLFSLGKAFPHGVKDMKSKTRFADVAGLSQAKIEVMEFVDFLKDPKKYESLGARIPKGALLVGSPGTGKTLLAKAVAGEAGVPFLSMSGSDFLEVFVGIGPSRVRDLFQQASQLAPSIVFIDEIDAIGRKRGKGGFSGGGNDERENTLNQILVEMDGFTTSTGVVVFGATNRPDILDPALVRAGRFDRQISIPAPDLEERESILKVHLKPLKLDKSVLSTDEISKRLAALSPGLSGADLANVCNEAAIFAARRSAEGVARVDFEEATDRVLGGMIKKHNLMDQNEKRRVAIHEAGHALVGWFLEHANPLLKVSIVPRTSGALGFAQYLPEDIRLFSKEALNDKLTVLLGGRAAEEIFMGNVSTGVIYKQLYILNYI
eukprot:GHVL01012841.1.p1 GENE.GHVL01012841.1~~GHVL01012841.1.p1  ORF type:complete len:596 (-),score=103.19 GHVL01012841.1:441-2228(-)